MPRYWLAYRMVFSLAPNIIKSGSFVTINTTLSTIDIRIKNAVELPRIRSAPSWSFCPIQIDALGAPPMPTRAEKAEISKIIGNATPSPANAMEPVSGILPT